MVTKPGDDTREIMDQYRDFSLLFVLMNIWLRNGPMSPGCCCFRFNLSEVIFPNIKCSCRVIKKISTKLHQGALSRNTRQFCSKSFIVEYFIHRLLRKNMVGTIAHNRKHKCKLKHCLVTTVFVGRGYVTKTLFSAALGQF